MNENQIPQMFFAFAQVGAYLRSEKWRAAEQYGLTPTQLGILALIYRRGPCRVQKLADLLGVSQATISDSIGAVLSKELVSKLPDPADKRASLIALTPKGRKSAADNDRIPGPLEEALSELSDGEDAVLNRALNKIIRSLQIAGSIEPQRLCVTCRFFRANSHKDVDQPHHCAFVDAAFGDAELRFDCGDHIEADEMDRNQNWAHFVSSHSAQ